MPDDKKISGLIAAGVLIGPELFEVVQGGINLKTTAQEIADLAITREFNRAFSSELLFDNNEIDYESHTQTAAIEFTVASVGHLVDQFSIAIHTIIANGVNTITFTGYNFIYGIQSGAVPDAGTYQVFFMYRNGVATVNWTEPSSEEANLTTLSTPTNFAAVPGAGDPETEVDLSWTAVANASSYELQYSLAGGGGPWLALATPASGDTTYTHTGLTAATTYHYRIRAIGDLVVFSNSAYVIDATTTEDTGDVTAPTFTFLPADAATDIPVNRVVVITCSEPIRDADGVTEITNANITDYLVVKVNNGAGADIPYTATIDATKTIVTITPNVVWASLGNVFIQISGVEDVNGNESATDDATFTCNDYTEMNANYLNLDQQFNAIVTGNDINFELEIELKDIVLSGYRGLYQKQTTVGNQFSFIWVTDGNSVEFSYHATSGVHRSTRTIRWTNILSGFTAGKLTLTYDGTIDTNNGLDRVDVYIDDVVQASKSLSSAVDGFGITWPFAISSSTAALYIAGPTFREAKNAIIRNNAGATVQGNYPILRTGEDTSGNNRDGTWI